jgi:signal transduction histidine kinase
VGIRSSVGCPIVVAGQVWGVIAASRKSDEPFAANTESQIASFTELVATAIENAEARAELRRMADEQTALRRVATLVARGGSPELVFDMVAEELGQLTNADITGIFRFESDGTATMMGIRGVRAGEMSVGERRTLDPTSAIALVQATGESARYDVGDAMLREWGIQSAVGSPINVAGRRWGGISIASRHAPFPPDTEQRLVEFTEIVATAIANAESQAQLTASRARVVAAGDEMRRRLERDLHDGAQQRLVSLALELRAAQGGIPAYLPNLRTEIGQAAEDLTEVVDELREIARGIHPAILVESGLGPALRTLARRAAVPVDLKVGTRSRYPSPLEIAVYYVASEALTNMAKHAGASCAEISLEERAGPCGCRSGMTVPAVPNHAADPVWSACRTESRRWAGQSSSSAPPDTARRSTSRSHWSATDPTTRPGAASGHVLRRLRGRGGLGGDLVGGGEDGSGEGVEGEVEADYGGGGVRVDVQGFYVDGVDDEVVAVDLVAGGGAAPPKFLVPKSLRTWNAPLSRRSVAPALVGSSVTVAGRFTRTQCQKPDGTGASGSKQVTTKALVSAGKPDQLSCGEELPPAKAWSSDSGLTVGDVGAGDREGAGLREQFVRVRGDGTIERHL